MLKQPLGSELPSLVPCPPAMSTTPTLFSPINFKPDLYHFSMSSGFESSILAVADSGRGLRPESLASSPSSGLGGFKARPVMVLMCLLESASDFVRACRKISRKLTLGQTKRAGRREQLSQLR